MRLSKQLNKQKITTAVAVLLLSTTVSYVANIVLRKIEPTHAITDATSAIQLIGNINTVATTASPQSRNVWTMQEFEGKIYLGHGDNSTATTPLIALNLSTNILASETTIGAGQINRFRIIDNTLYLPNSTVPAPAPDPTMGSFYMKPSGQPWQTKSTIQGANSVYDIASFDDKLYSASKTETDYSGATAVQQSTSSGDYWSPSTLKHQSTPVTTLINVQGNNVAVPNDNAAAAHIDWAEGTKMSTLPGIIAVREGTPSTYSMATGRANFAIVKQYLNDKHQLDVDDVFFLDNGTSTAPMLSLQDGDSIRMRGVGDTHTIIFDTAWNGVRLFDVQAGVDLYIEGIDFVQSAETLLPQDRGIFRYVHGDYHINEIIMTGCTFTGSIHPLSILGASADDADRVNPSTVIVDKLVIHNNIFEEDVSRYIFFIRNPWVKELRFTENNLHNSGWEVLEFLNDNTSNTNSANVTIPHNNNPRPSTLIIDRNTYINDADFDIAEKWAQLSNNTAIPTYFALAINKGASDILFTNNHIEGLHMYSAFDNSALYAAYLSGTRVLYENNTQINNIDLRTDKSFYSLIRAKDGKFNELARIYRNNNFSMTESFVRQVISDATYDSLIGTAELAEMQRVSISYTDSTMKLMVIENNIIDVPVLEMYPNQEFYRVYYAFNNNQIDVDNLIGMGSGYSSFVTMRRGMSHEPDAGHPIPNTITRLSRTMFGNTINVREPHDFPERNGVSLICGYSYLPSTINIDNNIFNMANLGQIFADECFTGASPTATATPYLPHMTLNFNNNTVTRSLATPIPKKRVANQSSQVFNSFNNNIGDFSGTD